MEKSHLKVIKKPASVSTRHLLIFAILFGLVGGFIIIRSFAAPNPNLAGDLNGDNVVDSADLTMLQTVYGTTNAAADINADGTVNILDLSILVSNFGQIYTPPSLPTVNLTANPTSITSGQSSNLTWTSTNATSCTASGAWSGSKATSGSASTGALSQTSTYTITCTGAGGTSSPDSATVTVSGGGSSFVPGACGTGGCTASTVHGFNIIVPDSTPPSQGGNATGEPLSCTVVGPGCVTRNFQIYRPGNLLTNPKPPLLIAYSGSVSNNPQWYADASQRGYVIAIIFNSHDNGAATNNLQYALPTMSKSPPAPLANFTDCGVNGASYCDDIPQVTEVLNKLNCPYVSGGSASLCQGYNTSEVFVEGGSKGGLATMATACDTRTSSKIAGTSSISVLLVTLGSNASVPPPCPAMFPVTSSCVSNCLTVAPNRNITMQWLWGSSDPGGGNTTCSITAANDCFGNGYLDAKGFWHIGLIQSASDVFGNRVLGCSSTPASSTTTGQTGKITTKTYRGCTNPNLATQTVDVFGGLHQPDTWPCNSLNGIFCSSGTDFSNADGLSEPAAAWAFWTAYFP